MNIKYWFEFKGLDDVLNRVEILTDSNVMPEEVHAPDEAFSLQYLTVKKLDVVQGSQATLRLISQKIFEFIGLHTDDMQEYTIRFYRDGRLYWLGFLDSELYSENLTDYPPYPVEFAGADFNITKRLKYRDGAGNRYTDVVPLITHLKRCFDLLGLPFDKLYIGCTTMANDVPADASETALHVLYMMSANFYDEDNEPMTCREVMENILRPFGLMMVQKSGSVFIYDYNTVKLGLPMKRYNFSSFTYEAEEMVNFDLGDISDIKTLTTDASFGFEEMINNVQITSSLYGEKDLAKYEVVESKLGEPFLTTATDAYTKNVYIKYETWNAESYVFYKDKETESTLIGALLKYTGDQNVENKISFYVKDKYLIRTDASYYINVLAKLYINTRDNPFSDEMEEDGRTRMAKLYADLVLYDHTGLPIMYYCNWYKRPASNNGWKTIENGNFQDSGKFVLKFSQESVQRGRIANIWLGNSIHKIDSIYSEYGIMEKNFQRGVTLPIPPVSGYLKLSFLYCIISDNAIKTPGYPDVYPAEGVRDLLINDVEISIRDADGKNISTDDYIFKSYVNKKVATDFKNIDLKCISANEENLPIGKANILKKVDNHYKLQLSFTRNRQTNILERLLMCTIHSNHTKKNVSISATVKMTENPALAYCTYKNVIHSDGMYITGATLDFYNAMTTIKAEEFSADDARISDIPYD